MAADRVDVQAVAAHFWRRVCASLIIGRDVYGDGEYLLHGRILLFLCLLRIVWRPCHATNVSFFVFETCCRTLMLAISLTIGTMDRARRLLHWVRTRDASLR